MDNRCVCCGEIIPEGRQVCPNCEKKAKERDAIDFCGELCAFAEDIINRAKQKWIPVTERLPEEEGWYLVYTTPNREHKSINKAMFCKGYAWGNFEPYWRGAGGHWANVTHWMPLPQPPKGE